jgi:DNA polymerase-3 subunit alpha
VGSCCRRSLQDDYPKALELAGRLQSIFGRENFFIEMQDHGIPEQLRTNPSLLEIARDLKAPLLATNDLHYVHHDDAEMHDALLCIGTGSLVADPNRFRFHSDQHYLKSAAEMRYLFRDLARGLRQHLARSPSGRRDHRVRQRRVARVPDPGGEYQGATHKEGAHRLLRELSYQGAHERYGEGTSTTR